MAVSTALQLLSLHFPDLFTPLSLIHMMWQIPSPRLTQISVLCFKILPPFSETLHMICDMIDGCSNTVIYKCDFRFIIYQCGLNRVRNDDFCVFDLKSTVLCSV